MGLFRKGQPTALKRVKFDMGNEVHINLRELSSVELLQYQDLQGDKEIKNMDFVFDLIAKCACDDDGKPMFDSADDVKENFNIGMSRLLDIQKVVLDLSGIAPKN